jgi:hypothetical protein
MRKVATTQLPDIHERGGLYFSLKDIKSLMELPAGTDLYVKEHQWPKEREVGRKGDMSPVGHLRVGLDSDNDVYLSIYDGDGSCSVEFCCPGSGGGKSARTREALIALMIAMEQDNLDTPGFNWRSQ